jgi:hypothetical protein
MVTLAPEFPLLLAPMEDVSDPFRTCKMHGAYDVFRVYFSKG